ncbi:unnamed protein product [Ostreobium quekettii]|uniref:RING-type E3 ubiquitin transferase n=1 Tax=Ostreobium quekettii TaxID=121088 RepID=A0A8S1IQC6_9CHLO|nr:unnamed protein product [Ostreobium quekettii]
MGLKKQDGAKCEGLALLLRAPSPEDEDGQLRVNSTPRKSEEEEFASTLRYVLDLDTCREPLCRGSSILFRAVESCLSCRIASIEVQAREEAAAEAGEVDGRLGPAGVRVDKGSVFGHLAVGQDGLSLGSEGSFSSCRGSTCVFKGKWMYEVTLVTAGIQQVGWATLRCKFNNEEGVGDGADSYAFDGKRVRKWCVHPEAYGQAWAPGDVLGCCLNLDEGQVTFCRNGVSLGVAYDNVRTVKPHLGYFPAVSLSHGERCELNFGSKPLRYPVEGYRSIQDPPRKAIRCSAAYLFDTLARLIDVTATGQSPLSRSTNVMLSRPRLSTDDRTLLAATVMENLQPLLQHQYVVLDSLLPFLRMVLDRPYQDRTHDGLHIAIDMLESTLSKQQFDQCMTQVITALSKHCGSSPFLPRDLPCTASHPHLVLMNALLDHVSVASLFVSLPNLDEVLEGFLTRKQPTADDLQELLPNVWWKGLKDERFGEERMATMVATLSAALGNIEKAQHDLFSRLLSTKPTPVMNFFVYLLKKNHGASRNIQPLGLSDVSVLVSSFNLLLRLLRPYLTEHSNQWLGTFPVAKIFLDGILGEQGTLVPSLHQDLPRLGGTLSYLLKEYPIEAPDHFVLHLPPDAISTLDIQDSCVPPSLAAPLLHVLVLLYRLGIEAALKMTVHQFQHEASLRLSLIRNEQRLARSEGMSDAEQRRLAADIQKQREEEARSVRNCTWYKVVLFSPWKQECLFVLTVYISRLLSALSGSGGDMFRFAPEVYVECMLELFQAVSKADARFAPVDRLEAMGLQHVIDFLVHHFNHPMVLNPQICDALLQALGALFSDKDLLATFEHNPEACDSLVPSLLESFDSRYWLSISNIFLSMAKGTGFGQAGNPASGSRFRQIFLNTCLSRGALLDGFLNRLFNTLNWTVTEMTVTIKEINDITHARGVVRGIAEVQRQYRKATVLFNLSINLLRMLELVTHQMPGVFLCGSKLNLTRLVEVVAFILSHVTTGSDARVFEKVLEAPGTPSEFKSKVSRTAMLAPLAGVLIDLQFASKSADGKKRLQSNLPEGYDSEPQFSLAEVLAESTSPTECLDYLKSVDWKLSFPGASCHKSVGTLSQLLSTCKESRRKMASSTAGGIESEESLPDEFLDPIVMTLMEDPVVLPDSKITVDRSTIKRHLLSQSTDPFSRAELKLEMVTPDVELKSRIEAFLTRARKGRK